MSNCGVQALALNNVCDDLFCYAIDRNEMNLILDTLPETKTVHDNRNVLEYEIQLLRILAVGWAISFFMFDKSEKIFVLETFWKKIQDFADQLSSTTSLTLPNDIDYFEILKLRTDTYVNSLNSAGSVPDPVAIIGPKFAELCSLTDNACVVLAGSKLFSITINAVKEYLDSI